MLLGNQEQKNCSSDARGKKVERRKRPSTDVEGQAARDHKLINIQRARQKIELVKEKSKVRKRDEKYNQQKIDVPEKVIGCKNLCNMKVSSSVEEQN